MAPKKLFGVLLSCLIVLGCTRDDICPEETATTPLLVITFKDFADGVTPKEVPGLLVLDALDITNVVVPTQTTDSIAIPLKNFNNITPFLFVRDSDAEEPDDVNPDQVFIAYTLRDVYLNRACGFSVNYDNLSTLTDDLDDDNWILSLLTLVDTIDNQNETHITILH